jgi:hypothetical protein
MSAIYSSITFLMVVFQTRLMQKVWVHFVRDLVWCIADFNTSMSHAVKH